MPPPPRGKLKYPSDPPPPRKKKYWIRALVCEIECLYMVNTYLNVVEVHMYVDCLIQENVGLCTSSRNETIPVYESHILNFVIFQIKRCYMLTREALFLMCYTSRIVIIYWIFRFYWDSTRCLDWRLPRISGQSIITFNFRFHVCKLDPNFCSFLPVKNQYPSVRLVRFSYYFVYFQKKI